MHLPYKKKLLSTIEFNFSGDGSSCNFITVRQENTFDFIFKVQRRMTDLYFAITFSNVLTAAPIITVSMGFVILWYP